MSERTGGKLAAVGAAGVVGALALGRAALHSADDVGRAAMHATSLADDGVRVVSHADDLAGSAGRAATGLDDPMRAAAPLGEAAGRAEAEALNAADEAARAVDPLDLAQGAGDITFELVGDGLEQDDENGEVEEPIIDVPEAALRAGVARLAAVAGSPLARPNVLDLHDGADMASNLAALGSASGDPLLVAGRRQGDAIGGIPEDELWNACLGRAVRCVIVGTTSDDALAPASSFVHGFEGQTFDALATALKDQRFDHATVSVAVPTGPRAVLVVRSQP